MVCGITYTMYGCLGEGGFLIFLSSTVGMNGDFDRDRDLDQLLEDDEELELELDRDERDELDEDLQQPILTKPTIDRNDMYLEE